MTRLLIAGESEPVDLFFEGVDISDATSAASVSDYPGVECVGWAEVAHGINGNVKPLTVYGRLVWYPVSSGGVC